MHQMNKELLPYLYGNDSIPTAILKFGVDMNLNGDSEELQKRANTLLVYRDYIIDKKMIFRLRSAGYDLAKNIRLNSDFRNIRFTITGRRKSLYAVDDKITDCQARGREISINDILGIRIIVHNLEPEGNFDELAKLAVFIIEFFKSQGFVPMPAQTLKDTDTFKPESHPNIFVPSDDILPLEYRDYAKDYIAHPKENGYQTIQGVMADPLNNKVFEWQLRTMCMHVHAEVLAASHDGYKESKISNRDTNGKNSLETETVDYSRIKTYGFMATGIEEKPFVDMVGLLVSQPFLQSQRISSLAGDSEQ